MNKNIKKAHGHDHTVCSFGITQFNKVKRDKEFIKKVREKEKKNRDNPYNCPDGFEWDIDTNKCVPVTQGGATVTPVAGGSKPDTPQNLRITNVGTTFISLAWDAITNPFAYKIFFKKQGGTTYAVTTRGTTANFQGFVPDTLYTFYVKAVDATGSLSTPSDRVAATTLKVAPPSNSAVVYVDFDGGVLSGTPWNHSGDITYDPSGLTLAEEDAIIVGVKALYAPYNVFVTTDKSVYDAATPNKRTRVIVTETYEWYCGATPCAGGVGYVGSMFWGDNTPCWAFTSALAYGIKYITDCITHEVGHTIGLRHQSVYNSSCVKTAEYNPGNSVCACAPIMGVSYYQPNSLWWTGTSSVSCTTIQDDNQFITTKVGLK